MIRIPCGDLTNEIDDHLFQREIVQHNHDVYMLGQEMWDKKMWLMLINVACRFVDVH